MQIEHIPLERLSVSTLNMRRGRKTPDVSDILPSVMKRGVLQVCSPQNGALHI